MQNGDAFGDDVFGGDAASSHLSPTALRNF
jgi:hypothetical protein